MKKTFKNLKKIRFLNFFRRVLTATSYFNKKYFQILKWGVKSKEDSNYTYDLTEDNITYLAQIISLATQKSFESILQFINEARNDNVLKETIFNTIQKSPFRKFADLDIHFGRRVGWYAFVRALKPRVVIETGVDKGMGSVLLCAAILRNREEGYPGQYYGTDINPDAGYLLTGKYKEGGKILYGDSIQSLLQFEEPIDLFINDSDHFAEYEYREYQTIKNKLSKDAIILGDNSHITNKLSLFSIERDRNFLLFREKPHNHWYPGAGIGISFPKK